jgi:hypothetical protein
VRSLGLVSVRHRCFHLNIVSFVALAMTARNFSGETFAIPQMSDKLQALKEKANEDAKLGEVLPT